MKEQCVQRGSGVTTHWVPTSPAFSTQTLQRSHPLGPAYLSQHCPSLTHFPGPGVLPLESIGSWIRSPHWVLADWRTWGKLLSLLYLVTWILWRWNNMTHTQHLVQWSVLLGAQEILVLLISVVNNIWMKVIRSDSTTTLSPAENTFFCIQVS